MSRPVIILLLLLTGATGAAVTVLMMRADEPGRQVMPEEQRLAREKFFGSGRELPPIEKGQEMRPRW